MSKYYMGIDNGGTSCKVAIFDIKGKEISSAFCNLDMITPKAGFTERDMNELWRVNCKVIKEAILKSGINAKSIKGVACTGHGKGLYLWGKDNKPCYNGILSTDNRASEYTKRWDLDGTRDRVYEKTFQKILPCQPVSLLCWLKDNEPSVISNIKWIFSVKDYIRYRLTGEAYTEITDCSGTNLMNIRDVCFDRELLKEFGLEDIYEALPALKYSTDLCGTISETTEKETEIIAGTPVAGGMFDIDACAIAMNITNEENIAVIAGTWGINEYISKEPVLDKSIMMNSLYCIKDYYLIEESSPTSAGNNEWFVNMFMDGEKSKAKELGINIYKYCDELAKGVAANEQNIIFLPYLYGSNYNSQAKATFVGIDSHHTKAHIARAVLEGIVFCHKVHIEKLLANRETTRAVRLAGGAAKSRFWAQIFADVFNLSIEIVDANEIGALGCAMSAAVVSGEYKNIEEASKNMVKIKYRLDPIPENVEAYKRKFELYLKVSKSLNGLWKEFNQHGGKSMFDSLKHDVLRANKELFAKGLITYTWGNVSGIDRESGIIAIKPSGVGYDEMTVDDIVLIDLSGKVIEGKLNPSSDTPTHIALYKAFPDIGGICHTHSKWATSWAQAGMGIPAYGTTHADYYYGEIPCTREMSKEEIESDYEKNTGNVIVETFNKLNYNDIPGVLVKNHGPFTWGKDANESVYNSVVLEEMAMMAIQSKVLNPKIKEIPQTLLDKHFLRKHGENAYYGQKK